MTTERWQRIKAILYEAMELPDNARDAFLDEACGEDADLRAEVKQLLAADEQAASFLNEPPSVLDEWSDASQAGGMPSEIGPYRIVEQLGEGGMGEVFLAERADGLYQRRVALKLVKRFYDDGTVLRRFEAERQILATLEHPNIARLLGGGTTDDGRPYFTMEYVDGIALTTYVAERTLSLPARLRLIASVGEAVHYAHRNLVVHRDLKPSNILITEDDQGRPQVRLLDFGIAKLLQEKQAGGLTQTGGRPMTRAYAAPEQIRGEAITTATDIYTLGVVLYELLTGNRPFAAETPFALEQAILETDPAAPSTVVRRTAQRPSGATAAKENSITDSTTTGERWARRIQGDLDVLCLKALHKDPAQRYASAEAFVADIRRYLTGQPIEARPPTRSYRIRKFVQRHRAGVATAAAMVLLILAFGVTMAVQSARLAQERDRAELALERAEEVTDFMVSLFEASNPDEEQERLSAAELLDRGIEQAAALAEQPEVQAQMMFTVGQALGRLSQYAKADSMLTQALAIRRGVHGPVHEDVAQSLESLGWLRSEGDGDYEAAQAYLQEAIDVYQQLDGAYEGEMTTIYTSLGAVLFYQSDFAEAERVFRTTLEIQDRQPPSDAVDEQRSATLNNLGLALIRQSKYDEAEEVLGESLALNRRLHGEEHPSVATNLNILGTAQWYQDKFEEAKVSFLDVLERRKALYGDEHPAVAAIYNNLGSVYQSLGDLEQAEAHGRNAIAIQRKTQGPQHPRLAQGLENLGRTLRDAGKYDEAEAAFEESLAIYIARFGTQHTKVGAVRRNLHELYLAWDRPDKAAEYAPRTAESDTEAG